jgi:hypothetical protein
MENLEFESPLLSQRDGSSGSTGSTTATLWARVKKFASENKILCIVLGALLVGIIVVVIIIVMKNRSKTNKKESFDGTDAFSDGTSYVKSWLATTIDAENLV